MKLKYKNEIVCGNKNGGVPQGTHSSLHENLRPLFITSRLFFYWQKMDFRSRKKLNVSNLSDEQLMEFIESVETDEDVDFSSDDDINDPDFVLDEISSEVERYISMMKSLHLSMKRAIFR